VKLIRYAATLLLALSASAGAAPLPFRIDSAQSDALAKVDVARRIDYGSFQWVWMEASAARAIGVESQLVADATLVRIGDVGRDPTLDTSSAALDEQDRGLHIVQFYGPSKRAWVDELNSEGFLALQYLPHNALLVYGNAAALRALDAPHIRAVTGFDRSYKIDRSLRNLPASANDRIIVMFASLGNAQALLQNIRETGVAVLEHHATQPDAAFFLARVRADAAQRERLLALPSVVNVSYEPEPQFDDEVANQIIAKPFTTPAELLPQYLPFLQNNLAGLDGQGVTWAVIDSGADRDHPDLAPAWVGGATNGCTSGSGPGDDGADGGHGTHVAGAIVGRGVGDGGGIAAERDANGFLYGLGVAPAAQLWAARIICSGNTLTNVAATASAIAAGASGSNNSWNNGAARSGYTASAREYDALVRDGDFSTSNATEAFQVMFSAGNQGTAGLTAPHEAKNIISVANSGSTRSATGPNLMNAGSSRGPAVDGRILPILTAVGTSTASTRNGLGGANCVTAIAGTESLYSLCSGTSMSTPRASGAAALVTQWWQRNNLGVKPSPAMVKAILVNGARDLPGSAPGTLTNIDGSRPIPNNDEGWGIINLQDTLATTVRGQYYDQRTVLTTVGSEQSYRFKAVDPQKPLKITLAWTDAPGAVGANPALVNNLDLIATNNTVSYLGNVFQGGASATGGSADTLANLENIYISNPGSGTYNVRVIASAINGDALSGNGTPGSPRQDYALVCTNCLVPAALTLTTANANNSVAACFAGPVGPVDLLLSDSAGELATLSVVGAGFPVNNVSFTPSSVIPSSTGTSIRFRAQVAASATAGPTPLTLRASTASASTDLSMTLNVVGLPLANPPELTTPAAGQSDVPLTAAFDWVVAAGANGYRVELSRDPLFAQIWHEFDVATNALTLVRPLRSNTTYYWRVKSNNLCGPGVASSARSFTTVDVGGALFSDGFGE
jgi:hypothetical protein